MTQNKMVTIKREKPESTVCNMKETVATLFMGDRESFDLDAFLGRKKTAKVS